MKGSLAEGLLPEVLRDLYVGRKTGFLHFTRGDERRSLYFRKGHIVHADTNVKEEHLGETLVAQGVLTAADLERATRSAVSEDKRLGGVFLEMQILDKDKLEDALAVHVREILLRVLEWSEGEYQFEEREDLGVEPDFALKLSTGELILETVRKIGDPDVIRYALGDLNRILDLSSDPLLRFQKITLTPADGYVLSRVDGTMSAGEILQLIPMAPEDTMRSLFGLLCTGVLQLSLLPPKTPRGEAGRAGSAPPPLPSGTPAPPPRAASQPPPPRPAPAPPAPPASRPAHTTPAPPLGPAREARRQEILETHSELKTKNHFEVLGIPKASNVVQVKEAYFRLAKKFHPDTHHDPALTDLSDRIEAIFIRLGEAYEVLRNPASRSSYEADLASRASRAPTASAHAEAPPPPDPAQEAKLAEEAIKKAEKLYSQEKYWDAIQLLEPAIRNAEGKMKNRGRVALAKAYLKNPKWVKRAEEQLQAVVMEDPAHAEAHFVLAGIYKGGGLRSRALHEYQRVLELKPDHEEAAAQVLELTPETLAEEDKPAGGFLKKLFGKS